MQERRCYRRADATLYEESVQRTTDCSPGELLLLHYVQHTIIMLFCSQVLSMLDVYAFQGVSCWDIYWRLLGVRMVMAYATKLWKTPPEVGRPLRILNARCRRLRQRGFRGFIRDAIATTCYIENGVCFYEPIRLP